MGNTHKCMAKSPEIVMVQTVRCRACGNFHECETSDFACGFCGFVNRKKEVETSEVCQVNLFRTSVCMYAETGEFGEKNFPIEIGNCNLCMDALGDCVLLSCGHGGFCQSCAGSVAGNFKQCPVCRSEISKIFRVLHLRPDCATTVEIPVVKIAGDFRSVPKVPKKKKALV